MDRLRAKFAMPDNSVSTNRHKLVKATWSSSKLIKKLVLQEPTPFQEWSSAIIVHQATNVQVLAYLR